MKLLIGAGGTGGHIIPALAIALELSARNWKVVFVGNRGSMEETIVKEYSLPFLPIQVQKIYRSFTIKHFKFPFLLIMSIVKSTGYIKQESPDAVLCTGGFVSGPVALSAILQNKVLYIQDGNSYPGLTTRFLSKYARHIFTASNEALRFLTRADCIQTGNPIMAYNRIEQSQINWSIYNLSKHTKKLFVIGGSQGSKAINNAVREVVERALNQNIEIIWQTGKSHFAAIHNKYQHTKGIYCFDFTDKMSDFYQMSDAVISRAGALSLAELIEHKLPAILIPLPTAAENHQQKNALVYAESGFGLVLEQHNLNSENLMRAVTTLFENLYNYKEKLNNQPSNQATKIISDIIEHEVMQIQEKLC